jgi:2-polyprenyl-6-methoxyphenol hydroxylase-like FAD-dependent oxidoreductase
LLKLKKIVICGGGIAGAGVAAALSTLNYSLILLEKDSLEDVGTVRRGETLRSEACKVLAKFGFMPYFEREDAIVRIGEVRELFHSELGKLGEFHYDYLAPEYPVIHTSHKGMVSAMYSRLEKIPNLEIKFNAQAISLSDFKEDKRTITYRSRVDGADHELDANLVVIADGATSRFRNILFIPTEQYDYRVGYLMFYLDHPNELKWGRFCLGSEGFIGVFPTGGDLIRAAVEVKIEDLKDWLTATSEEQEKRLSKRASVLEGCKIEETGFFYHVLRRQISKYTLDGLCFVGDSAHTTHPMQAQGMSMVFNDIESLFSVLQENEGKVLTDDVLSSYELKARPFNSAVLENNNVLFNLFHRLCEDKSYFKESLMELQRMGFSAAPFANLGEHANLIGLDSHR